jgi:chaperonin GroES
MEAERQIAQSLKKLQHHTQRVSGNVRPLHDNVLVRKEKAPELSRGGIFVAVNGAKEDDYGIVLAVGPGKLRKDGGRAPMWVAPGDCVFFSPHGNRRIDSPGAGEVVMVKLNSIIGVIEGD